MESKSEKILLGASALILAASAGYYFLSAPVAGFKPIQVSGSAYEPSVPPAVVTGVTRWLPPEPQASLPPPPGELTTPLVIDLFTPPKIYYTPATKSFTTVSSVKPPPPYPFELVKVYQKPFRLQLQGFQKLGPNEYQVVLRDEETKKIVESVKGKVVQGTDIFIDDVEVKEVVDAKGAIYKVATVALTDRTSGRKVTLQSGGKTVMDVTWYIVVRNKITDQTQEVKVGEVLKYEGQLHTIKALLRAGESTPALSVEYVFPNRMPEVRELPLVKPATE